MKWIVLAIAVVAVPYTFLTLYYRRPGKAFQPYADMKDRANTMRLLSAKFQRITLHAQRPADSATAAMIAPISPAPGGLPEPLRASLVDEPFLPAEILSVSATPNATTADPYVIQLGCSLPDDRRQLAGAHLYLRESEIYLVPHFETIGGELLARTRQNVVSLIVPPGALKPGSYRVTAVGQRASKSWTLQVH